MKKVLVFLFVLLFPALCVAHIGTSTVVTDGTAGAYRLRVVVRPPDVIPGRAEIDVRFLDPVAKDTEVTVLPVSAAQGLKGAPKPDVAQPVRGDPALRHGELWLMTTGSYSVHIDVSGALGKGKFVVPVDAVATRSLPMPKALGGLLVVLGAVLFSGAVTLASSGARQSISAPQTEPTRAEKRRSIVIALIASALFCSGLIWMKRWWGYEDWTYRNKIIYTPRPLGAKVWTENGRSYLRLSINPRDGGADAPLVLLPDHGKLMHLFAIREPQLDAFAHLHPIQLRPGVFDLALPSLPEGTYRLYSDITYENGFAATLSTTVTLPGGSSELPAEFDRVADPDDSWFIPTAGESGAQAVRLVGRNDAPLRAGEPLSLAFKAIRPDGSAAELEPYLGMLGHAAVRRSDGSVFAHLHPVGTISMASQQYFESQAGLIAPGADPHAGHHRHHGSPAVSDISFPFEFPRAGSYRIWVQGKVDGKVVTGVFDYNVGDKE